MASQTSSESDVLRICRDLIRIDTSNYGPGTEGPGEREAAEYVVGQLQEVGLEPELFESEPGRANVVVRIPGADRERGALVVHGHLDVVPADAADWSHDPFAADVEDGCVWGRGAVDMKDMDAMILATVRDFARRGVTPPRDLVVAFFADEEAGGVKGSHWAVDHRPELFEGATEAISEVGGYSVTVPKKGGGDQRAYLLQTGEKGIRWIRLTAHGRAGHGSVPNDENAIARLAAAIGRIDAHVWPRQYVASVRQLLDGLADITGTTYTDEDTDALLAHIPGARTFVEGALANVSNPTMLDAGYKHNVIPQTASVNVDCRFLPGDEDELMDVIAELAGEHVTIETLHRDIALDAPFEGHLVERMKDALRTEDPGCEILPYCLSAGTDNKALKQLGINGYGFTPLRLPSDLLFAPMFHGIDERVPVESLEFGQRVLARLLTDC
ncbi:M20/M25/M40 family metallo-hydrolase [Dermacoccus nishinomiyaensis]